MQDLIEAFRLLFTLDPEVYGIIGLTLRMALTSTCIASVLGILCGLALGQSGPFCGKRLIENIIRTFMSLPPVVAGLVVYLLLSRNGPLGALGLLYSFWAMVIAQVILIMPIVTGLTMTAVAERAAIVRETCLGLGLGLAKQRRLLTRECLNPLLSAVVAGFGRAMSEVGAINIVGGNIQFRTRTMTTAIMTETSKGKFGYSLALGIILLLLSFLINWGIQAFAGKDARNDR